MLHPSYTDLMEVVNSGVEEGADPIVQSRYSIVIATARRARQLIAGGEALVPDADRKPLSVAIDELYKGKVKILSVDESDEDDEKIMEFSKEVLAVALDDEGLVDDEDVDAIFDEEYEEYQEEYSDED